LFGSINPGAPAAGAPFPNTNPSLVANAGETMAEVRGRIMCGGACKPTVNLVPADYWTPGAVMPTFDACYSTGLTDITWNPADPAARYTCKANGLRTALPTTESCVRNWTGRCRVTVNYEQQIHPLWSLDRPVDADADGVADVDPVTNVEINNRCDTCHNSVDAANAPQVAAGDLDLSDGPSEEDPDQKRAYRELLFADRGQILDANGLPVDECTQTQIDPVTNVEVCVAFRTVPAPLSVGNPRTSRFFLKFDGNLPGVDHNGLMNLAEYKLITEWLDIGAQYYNDPFLAPEN
jgi:hypothetical protein